MKTSQCERDSVLERLPGLLRSCDPVHDPAAASFAPLSFDQFARSFPLVWIFLSLLCLYTWLSLASFLVRSLDIDGSTMFFRNRSFKSKDPRVGKSARSSRKKREGYTKMMSQEESGRSRPDSPPVSPIVSLIVGPDQRMFVAHEDVLSRSPFFSAILRDYFVGDIPGKTKVITLPEEEPEILFCILEFLYKGDYTPRLVPRQSPDNNDNNTNDVSGGSTSTSRGTNSAWTLEPSTHPTTFRHTPTSTPILLDTAIYCAADKYSLPPLKRLALRKQGLRSGIPIDVILRSARYAYDHTPDSEYRLRAHYLAMVIQARGVFKDSGTMQLEMEMGHTFFFDLFVAMCNYVDDLERCARD
ncbi:hypothetical protein BO70DRAFT_357212 [Aspergillus heteromorphus CBS 117.55]|uniref:BTB domain-containing protein n=1 Tax=Aspergillus heteromorphus CBS 117.55 TaxID=1448321 RepID=A0A317X1J4_9EURO|nr:uncharacterized protein BO70DRAFT_357212 [Aspergillus heteromorphus CBS 117.55]PWY92061.1 hypothetical protein BO70DRAFT_357212 [Aspergillus heteromorphus CBS 117.55]